MPMPSHTGELHGEAQVSTISRRVMTINGQPSQLNTNASTACFVFPDDVSYSIGTLCTPRPAVNITKRGDIDGSSGLRACIRGMNNGSIEPVSPRLRRTFARSQAMRGINRSLVIRVERAGWAEAAESRERLLHGTEHMTGWGEGPRDESETN